MECRLTYDGTILLFAVEIPRELCRAQLYGQRFTGNTFKHLVSLGSMRLIFSHLVNIMPGVSKQHHPCLSHRS